MTCSFKMTKTLYIAVTLLGTLKEGFLSVTHIMFVPKSCRIKNDKFGLHLWIQQQIPGLNILLKQPTHTRVDGHSYLLHQPIFEEGHLIHKMCLWVSTTWEKRWRSALKSTYLVCSAPLKNTRTSLLHPHILWSHYHHMFISFQDMLVVLVTLWTKLSFTVIKTEPLCPWSTSCVVKVAERTEAERQLNIERGSSFGKRGFSYRQSYRKLCYNISLSKCLCSSCSMATQCLAWLPGSTEWEGINISEGSQSLLCSHSVSSSSMDSCMCHSSSMSTYRQHSEWKDVIS